MSIILLAECLTLWNRVPLAVLACKIEVVNAGIESRGHALADE